MATEQTTPPHEPVVLPPFLYRFRRTSALLEGHHELERQEIYFSLPEGLNDPMEGFKDIFWSGDEIVWRNLFKNYLLCLERLCVLYTMGDRIPLGAKHIQVAKTEDGETEFARALFRETCDLFFGDGTIAEYPKRLAARRDPVRRDELLLVLSLVHRHALNAIFAAFEKRGYKGATAEDRDGAARMSRLIANGRELRALANEVDAKATDRLHAGAASLLRQERLRLKHNNASAAISANAFFIWTDFPEAYIRELEQLIHPRWSTACFLKSATNPAMWAHYADAHKGVCLKFKTTGSGDGVGINQRGVVSISGNTSGATYHKLAIMRIVAQKCKAEGRSDFHFYEAAYSRALGSIEIIDMPTLRFGRS